MKIHIVKKGDTLYELSKKYDIDLKELVAANPQIENPEQIQEGMKVKIPSSLTPVEPSAPEIVYKHVVVQGDTLWKLSKKWDIPLQAMIKANPQLKNPNALLTGEIVNIPAVGTGAPHEPQALAGINLAVPMGDVTPPPSVSLIGDTSLPTVSTMEVDVPMLESISPSVELKEEVDLFAQYNVPATEVGSFYDFPAVPMMEVPPEVNHVPYYPGMPTAPQTAAPLTYNLPSAVSPGMQEMAPPYAQLMEKALPYAQQMEMTSPYTQQMEKAFPYAQQMGMAFPYAQQMGMTSPYAQQMEMAFPYAQQMGMTSPYAQQMEKAFPYAQQMGMTPPYAQQMGWNQPNPWFPAASPQDIMYGGQYGMVNPLAATSMMSTYAAPYTNPYIPPHANDCGCGGLKETEARGKDSGNQSSKATIKQNNTSKRITVKSKKDQLKAAISSRQKKAKTKAQERSRRVNFPWTKV